MNEMHKHANIYKAFKERTQHDTRVIKRQENKFIIIPKNQ